jgi:hypothetical protein
VTSIGSYQFLFQIKCFCFVFFYLYVFNIYFFMLNQCLWCHFGHFHHQNIEKLWYPRRHSRLIEPIDLAVLAYQEEIIMLNKIYILKTYKLKKQKQKHLIWNKKYKKKYMPNFCTLAVYFQLDNIRQGIASLTKYCIWNMNDNTSNSGYFYMNYYLHISLGKV